MYHFHHLQIEILESNAGKTSSNNGSLRHFNMHNSEDLVDECPWLYEDSDERRVYSCDQNNRPPYRPANGSCNHLSGFQYYV